MTATTPTSAAAATAQRVVALLREANDLVQELPMAQLGDAELLDAIRAVEVERNRQTAGDHRLLAELERRQLAHAHGCRDTKTLLTRLLRVNPGEAKDRLEAARDLGPRTGLTGEPLPPIFPALAAATAEGSLSARHAAAIVEAIDELPADVQAARGAQIEAFLVGEAVRFAPVELRKITRRLVDTYSQDGRLASDEDRARRRFLDAHQHADGSVSGRFHLDPIAGEAMLSVLDATARPVPGPNGERDPRTPGQRRHDGLKDALLMVLRSDELPQTGGVTTTILVTMTLEQYQQVACRVEPRGDGDAVRDRGSPRRPRAPGAAADGLVRAGHGALLSLTEVERLLGDAQVQAVVHCDESKRVTDRVNARATAVLDRVIGSVRRVLAYGSTHRFFTHGQRLALIARDQGCSFPGCTVPALWCEAHHVTDWNDSGPTTIDNGTLLCGFHHAHFGRLGYRCVMIDGVPHWIAPLWMDRSQTPIRNTANHIGN